MAQCSITLKVKVAWWVRPYINSIALFAWLTGFKPDIDKAVRTVLRGVSVNLATLKQ